MRTAPAIDAPVGDGLLWRGGAALLAASGAGVPMAWAGWHAQTADRAPALVWMLFALAAAGTAAALAWRARGATGRLRWTGTAWEWLPAGRAPQALVGVQARWDLGGALWLRARLADGGIQWLALERRHAGTAWHPLRVAVMTGARS